MSWQYGQAIWDGLKSEIGNEYGVAGCMGNLLAESGLIPYRVQGDFSENYSYSQEYTQLVDNGSISENDFIHNAPNGGGYGLAQWTYYTRKQALYNMKQEMGTSIGDVNLGIAYLLYELNNGYTGVMNILKTAEDIRTASDAFLLQFEQPADQSESVQVYRADLSINIYNEYHTVTPTPTTPKKKMPLYMMVKIF